MLQPWMNSALCSVVSFTGLLAQEVQEPARRTPTFQEWGELAVGALAFTLLGVVLFAACLWLIVKLAPFSIRKEIEEDQNTAVGIIIAAIILGLALILAAAIHG